MWLEPDVNIISGESLVRQIMRGVKFQQDEFGITPRVLWLPDTFGYTAAIPQLMALTGLDIFVTSKCSWNDTNRMPYDTFEWQGIDGSNVTAYLITAQTDDKAIGVITAPTMARIWTSARPWAHGTAMSQKRLIKMCWCRLAMAMAAAVPAK